MTDADEKKQRPPSLLSTASTAHEEEAHWEPDLILEAHQSIGGHELELCTFLQLKILSSHSSSYLYLCIDHSTQPSALNHSLKQKANGEDEDNQDGGWGWLVVLGGFMVQFSAFGAANAW